MNVTKETLLDLLGDRPIAYHPVLARVLNGVLEAVFVSQLLYWTSKGKKADGWIYKKAEDWSEETGLTRSNLETVRRNLKKMGVLEEKIQGVPGILHYRLSLDRLVDLFSLLDSRNVETPQCENPATHVAEIPQRIPENTHIDNNDDSFLSSSPDLPRAVDRHQRHIDAASGGQSLDPVLEVAKHLRWGCTGGAGIPLPRGKGKGEYTDAAKKLLDDTDADDWRGVCAAVDGWFEHPPDEDIWMHERAKKPHFALAQIADYWRAMHGGGKKKPANGRASPTSSWLSDEDLAIADADLARWLAEKEGNCL